MKNKLNYLGVLSFLMLVGIETPVYDFPKDCEAKDITLNYHQKSKKFAPNPLPYNARSENNSILSTKKNNNLLLKLNQYKAEVEENKKLIETLKQELIMQKEELQKLQIQIFALSELNFTEAEIENNIEVSKKFIYLTAGLVFTIVLGMLVWILYLQKCLIKGDAVKR